MVATFHLTWLNPYTASAMPFGWVGVQIFFVISGFVIANSASGATPLKFLEGRFLRLYPAAWICAAISCVAILTCASAQNIGIYVYATIKPIFGSITLLGPWFIANAYWSLPIEISFYSLVFLLLLSGRVDRIERLAFGLIAYSAVFVPILWMHWRGYIDAGWIDPGFGPKTMLLYRHGCYFGAGIYLWLWTKGRVSISGIFAVAVALLLAALEIDCRAIEVAHGVTSSAAIFAFVVAFIAIVTTTLLPSALKPGLKTSSFIRAAGLMTYPFYLLHQALGGNALAVLLKLGANPLASILATLILVGVTSWVVAIVLEPAIRRMMIRLAITHSTHGSRRNSYTG
jgi:exopolysaccharide production protein ExoZ